MKKKLKYFFLIAVLIAAVFAWLLFSSATTFDTKSKFIYVRKNQSVQQQVQQQLSESISSNGLFNLLASSLNVWQRVKPGRFEIKKDASLFDIIRMFRNNTQSPVKFTINFIRTNEDLAKLVGKNFETDSTSFMNFISSKDSLSHFGVDTNTLMSLVIPDTYFINWTSPPKTILTRLQDASDNFWKKNNRLQLAHDKGFTPLQIYIIASITEQETNMADDKGKVASVYINRLKQNMALAADPTIKFALRDFGLKRILYEHLKVQSPYNTYLNKGLPPGPICTPSAETIDAVLHAPETDYLFFVANADLSGYSHFSNNFAEHQQYAKLYQQAIDSLFRNKK